MLITFTNWLRGVNTNISPILEPSTSTISTTTGAPTVMNGVTNAWKLGTLIKDTGYSQVGSQIVAGKTIGGLYNFVQSAATEKMLATLNNAGDTATSLYARSNGAGAWNQITGTSAWSTTGQKVEMQGFLGYCFFVGYSAGTDTFLPVASLTGTTFSTSTNVTSMPQGKYIVRYRDRLYVLNCYSSGALPYRVYFSSVPTAGAITWTPATDFFDVDYDLYITGAGTNWDKLVIFTPYNSYIYDQTQLKQFCAQGCSNHRTIANCGSYMIWANMDGVWVSTGGQPQQIAGEVIDFIRNGNPANFYATVVDEVYHLYVGTVTVNGITYSNCTLKFNIGISTWEWREYSGNFQAFAPYLSSGKRRLYMADNNGQVWDKGKYTDATLVSGDAQATAGTGGNAIGANFELAPMYFDDLGSTKNTTDLFVFAERAQGLNMKARIIDRNTRILTPYVPLGQLTKWINPFQMDIKKGVFMQLAGSEYSTNPYFSWYGFAIDVEKAGKILRKTLK